MVFPNAVISTKPNKVACVSLQFCATALSTLLKSMFQRFYAPFQSENVLKEPNQSLSPGGSARPQVIMWICRYAADLRSYVALCRHTTYAA